MSDPINVAADLRIGADGATAAWMNGVQVWPAITSGTYHLDFLVGGEIDDDLNSILVADPSTETGDTAQIYHFPDFDPGLAGNDLCFVHLPAGVTITGFRVECFWSPAYDGSVDYVLTIDDASDFTDLLTATLNDTGTGITGQSTFDETTTTIAIGSMPFTTLVESVVSFAVNLTPYEAGHTITSGFLEFDWS